MFLSEVRDGLIPHNWWPHEEVGHTDEAKKHLDKLFDEKSPFDTPKPVRLVNRMLQIANVQEDDIVMDFFAGSCTTADAVMEWNASSDMRLRFIMIQLPEHCPEKSDAWKYGFKTIADIGKERIRRSAAAIKAEYPDRSVDYGFKVFKLCCSNISAWNPDRTDLEESLLSHQEHLIEGRSENDVLYELLLKRGVDLAVPIESREVAGKSVYSIGYGVLFACLNESIHKDQIEEIGQGIVEWHRELAPSSDTHVFFRDSAFSDDVSKTNMAAILEQNGINHVRSL